MKKSSSHVISALVLCLAAGSVLAADQNVASDEASSAPDSEESAAYAIQSSEVLSFEKRLEQAHEFAKTPSGEAFTEQVNNFIMHPGFFADWYEVARRCADGDKLSRNHVVGYIAFEKSGSVKLDFRTKEKQEFVNSPIAACFEEALAAQSNWPKAPGVDTVEVPFEMTFSRQRLDAK